MSKLAMIFHRKKDRPTAVESQPRMRGRDIVDDTPGTAPGSAQNPLAKRFQTEDEPDTIDLDQPARFHETPEDEPGEVATRILAGSGAGEGSIATKPLEDPVAGFLVVIRGPGRGSVSRLGYGMNSIGRHSSQRVSLDHGDQHISRENHCVVTFDSVTRKFYLQPGEGPNLAYLDDDPVLAPIQLAGGSNFRLGDTVLRLVALCGDDFSWEN